MNVVNLVVRWTAECRAQQTKLLWGEFFPYSKLSSSLFSFPSEASGLQHCYFILFEIT